MPGSTAAAVAVPPHRLHSVIDSRCARGVAGSIDIKSCDAARPGTPIAEAVVRQSAASLSGATSACTYVSCWRRCGAPSRRPVQRAAETAQVSEQGGVDMIFSAVDGELLGDSGLPPSLLEEIGVISGEAASTSCNSGGLVFAAFSSHRPGTRQVLLLRKKFYAFTFPRQGTVQLVVWRRLGDAVAAGYGSPGHSCPMRLTLLGAEDSPSPGRRGTKTEGPLFDLYSRRAYDRGAWVYWESFWAPIGTIAFTAVDAKLDFAPLLGATVNTSEAPLRSSDSAVWSPHTAPSEEKAAAFADVYRRGMWRGLLSRSGPGSDPFHPMVRVALTALDAVVDAFGVKSLLDAACGDARWMVEHYLVRRPELAYTGIDIVAHVIDENRKRYPHLQFDCIDLGSDQLHRTAALGIGSGLPSADLVFSKETFNHMVVQDAACAVHRLVSSGSKYLLVNIVRNARNQMGANKGHHANYAQYDYALPPFNLRKLAQVIEINREDWSEFALYALS